MIPPHGIASIATFQQFAFKIGQYQRSLGSKVKSENGRTEVIALPPMLTQLVNYAGLF